jgi:hypothetical protein
VSTPTSIPLISEPGVSAWHPRLPLHATDDHVAGAGDLFGAFVFVSGIIAAGTALSYTKEEGWALLLVEGILGNPGRHRRFIVELNKRCCSAHYAFITGSA